MTLLELIIIAVGVSMDAFAVAICKGLSMYKANIKKAIIVGIYFGFFQGFMPLVGYFLGRQFYEKINMFDNWIAFILLSIIGINMIRESSNLENCNDSLKFKEMFFLSIATSIDALAIGVTFALLNVDIFPAVSFIGIVTFFIATLGVKIGNVFGTKYKSKAE